MAKNQVSLPSNQASYEERHNSTVSLNAIVLLEDVCKQKVAIDLQIAKQEKELDQKISKLSPWTDRWCALVHQAEELRQRRITLQEKYAKRIADLERDTELR